MGQDNDLQKGRVANAYELITTYCVYSQDEDGRAIAPLAYFSSKASAVEFGKGKAAFGGNLSPRDEPAILLPSGEAFLLQHTRPIDLNRQQAEYDAKLLKDTLAKLSPEQKRVLGIQPAPGEYTYDPTDPYDDGK